MSLPRTIPDRTEWHSLRPPLEPGELALAELLDDTLPPGWVIAVQAQLWNSRPDVIAYNPEVGVGVFEVKDWDPGARQFRYSRETEVLEARSGPGESWYVTRDPVSQAIGYQEAVKLLYYEGEPARRFVTARVVLTNYPEDHELFSDLRRMETVWDREHERTFRVVGRETLDESRVHDLLPVAFDPDLQRPLEERTRQRIESLLTEQEASVQQRDPLVLDSDKKKLLRDELRSRYRIRGPAGSGKSVFIAAAAADAALSGRNVLVLVFNITQAHHLHDLAVRYRPEGTGAREVSRAVRQRVRFYYLHEWCEEVCRQTGYLKKFRSIVASHYGRYALGVEEIKGLVDEAVTVRDWSADRDTGFETFDRILIDEAQNIDADWYALVVQALTSDESKLIVACDPTQSLYLDEPSWTDERMPGFQTWKQFKYSYRLPKSMIPMLNDYCDRFLLDGPDIERPTADPQAELLSCTLSYRNMLGSGSLAEAVAELVNQLPRERGVHPGDIVFLFWDHRTGLDSVEYLVELSPGWQDRISTVFAPNFEMQKRKKRAFWAGVGETKGSTIHSFQGWESPCVILAIPEQGDINPDDELSTFVRNYWKAVYIGLTRVMNTDRGSHLFVVNAEPRLEAFLDKWFAAF